MKPGSLVIMLGFQHRKMPGVILRKSTQTHVWDNKTYQWWDILCGNEIIVEFETYLKLVE